MARPKAGRRGDGTLRKAPWLALVTVLMVAACDPITLVSPPPTDDEAPPAFTPLSAAVSADSTAGDTPSLPPTQPDGTTDSVGSVTPPADNSVHGLTVSVDSADEIALAWGHNASNGDGFLIQRYSDETGWADLAQVPLETTTFQDNAVSDGTLYCYRVAAYNAAGTSAFCDQECVSVGPTPAGVVGPTPAPPQNTTTGILRRPAAPSTLTVTAMSSDQVHLTWADKSSNEDGFTIQRHTSKTTWANYASVTSNTTTFLDTVEGGDTYCYRLRSFNAAGASTWSASKCVSVAAAPPPDAETPQPDPSPEPTDAPILEQMRALPPLPKVHYSWGLENGTLLNTADDPRLYEYVRITHAACVTGEWANEDRVNRAVLACAQVNATHPTTVTTIGINYSPWHRVFPAGMPPTYMGPEHDLEIATFRDKMTNVRNLIAAANAKYGANVTASMVLLNSEVWEVKQPGEPGADAWNAALDVKYNAIYDASKSVFPAAIVLWAAEGSGPYFTLREKTDGLFNTTAYNPAAPEINYPYMKGLLALCEQRGASAAAMWISLASGWQTAAGAPTTYRYDWDYDPVYSWELGRRLNAPRLDGMAVPIQYVIFWPAPFSTVTPTWGQHFVAYVRGANGLALQ
jgi:hypothetical protein